MASANDALRAAVLNLTTKDATVLEASLVVVLRLLSAETSAHRDLAAFHDESVIPRVCHVLTAWSSGATKPTPAIISLCCSILLVFIRDDESWAMIVARELPAKILFGMIRQIHPTQPFLGQTLEILNILTRFASEKHTAIQARLEGSLDLLMVILASHGLDDTGVCVYTLRLVLAYCKPSDTNVGVIIRKGGVVVLADLLTNYAHDTVIASLCVDCLALCARTDDNRKSLEVLDLCPQLVAMLANLMRQHISARDHAGFVASDVVHSAVYLLKLLCVADDVALSVWFSGGFVVLWYLIRSQQTPTQLLRNACDVAWKVIQVGQQAWEDTPATLAKGPGGLDLNACRLWRPPSPKLPTPIGFVAPHESGVTASTPTLQAAPSPTPIEPLSNKPKVSRPALRSFKSAIGSESARTASPETGRASAPIDDQDDVTIPRSASLNAMHKPVPFDHVGGPVGSAGVGFRGKVVDRFRKPGVVAFSDDVVANPASVLPIAIGAAVPGVVGKSRPPRDGRSRSPRPTDRHVSRSVSIASGTESGEEISVAESAPGDDTCDAECNDDTDDAVDSVVSDDDEEEVDEQHDENDDSDGDHSDRDGSEAVMDEGEELITSTVQLPTVRYVPRQSRTKVGDDGRILTPHSVIEQALAETGLVLGGNGEVGDVSGKLTAAGSAAKRVKPSSVTNSPPYSSVLPEHADSVSKAKSSHDASINPLFDKKMMKNRKVQLSKEYSWTSHPEWFPEYQIRARQRSTSPRLSPNVPIAPVCATDDAGLASGIGSASTPAYSALVHTLTSESGLRKPIPPPLNTNLSSQSGVGGKPGSIKSPRSRPHRISTGCVSPTSADPPRSPLLMATGSTPAVPLLDDLSSHTSSPVQSQLFQQRQLRVATVKPTDSTLSILSSAAAEQTPSESSVTAWGVISTRPFVVPYQGLPGIRHSLPPPAPEPFSFLSPEDRDVVINNYLRAGVASFARTYVVEADCVIDELDGLDAPQINPPVPHVGDVVYDIHLATATHVPALPLPPPRLPSSRLLDSFFEATTVQRLLSLASDVPPACTCDLSFVPGLKFESRFEGGNLRAAVRVAPTEYELILEPDTNTLGHTQWFFFRVDGMVDGMSYTFHTVNLEKAGSLYNQGMRPLVYLVSSPSSESVGSGGNMKKRCGHCSAVEQRSGVLPGGGWRRCGDGVCYYPNRYVKHPNTTKLAYLMTGGSEVGGGDDGSDDDNQPNSAPTALKAHIPSETAKRLVQGSVIISDSGSTTPLFTESWKVVFPAGTVAAFFAYCHPYGFSDLLLDLKRWDDRAAALERGMEVPVTDAVNADTPAVLSVAEALPSTPAIGGRVMPATIGSVVSSNMWVRSSLGRSLGGNLLPLITLTDFTAPDDAIKDLPYIILSARVHPGETNASWMMRGVIDFLTSSDPVAVALRSKAVFKIIPFLNPDGVINGHHRTGLSGVDLNRQWTEPDTTVSPTVYQLKELLATLVASGKDIAMFCDFHGHSRRKNVFMFGCDNEFGAPERVFPKLLSNRCSLFSFRNCSFKVQKAKYNCARVAVWRDLGIVNSFTIEASFAGPDDGEHANTHFSPSHYEDLGHNFCRSLLDMLDWTPEVQAVLNELQALYPAKFQASPSRSKKKSSTRGRSVSKGRSHSQGPPAKGSSVTRKPKGSTKGGKGDVGASGGKTRRKSGKGKKPSRPKKSGGKHA